MKPLPIIPQVNGTVEWKEGALAFPKAYRLESPFASANAVFTQRLAKLGEYARDDTAAFVLRFIKGSELPQESYRLVVRPDDIEIAARGEQGWFFGLTTLFQLLAQGNGAVPLCEITDAPKYAYRGLMLDVCRHFIPAEEVKKIIDQCAMLKMNALHWHLSEDQGFRIESKRFPKLNEIGSWRKLSPQDPVVEAGLAEPLARYGGYYTQEEIRDVVAYAAARQIEVIPEIDLPGHSSAILAAYPEFTCSGAPLRVKNTFGVHERIFCAGKEETYAFLSELLDEVMGLFPSQYIHLGGDEAPKTVWHDCPLCNAQMKRNGLQNYEQLQAYFTARLIRHVKAAGKTPIVWNESAASGTLDDAAIVQYWTEMAPGESYMVPEIAKGRRMILSDGDCLYCSNNYAEMPMKATLCYMPNVKGTPVPEENVQGIEAPMWTEWQASAEEIERLLWPRLLAVAELGWTAEKDAENFLNRAKQALSCAPLSILAPMPWEQATVIGDAAIQQVVRGLLTMGARYRNMTTGEAEEAAGKAEAITPDGSAKVDPQTMIRAFVTNKMKSAYAPEEIEKAIGMVMTIMNQRMGG